MERPPSPPPEVSRELFLEWRDARRGHTPAEVMTNPYWCWLLGSGESAWSANERFGGPSSYGGNPLWSAERFGQSTTALPDGRSLLVAGEHEDHYDPDFFIYNDVAVLHPDGRVEILGFPAEVFPPTDFHSATLAGPGLVLIGNLGYPEQRQAGRTQILVVDPDTWNVRKQASVGEGPGWIHGHEALAEEGSIRVRGGEVWTDTEAGLVENFDEWRLHLEGWRWERLTRRKVTVLELLREDGEANQLFEMSLWEFSRSIPDELGEHLPEGGAGDSVRAELKRSLRGVKPGDPEAYRRRFQPEGVTHRELPETEEHRERRIEVGGILVRYHEDMFSVRMTIEGELPDGIVERLREDLKAKLERIEEVPYRVRRLR